MLWLVNCEVRIASESGMALVMATGHSGSVLATRFCDGSCQYVQGTVMSGGRN